MIVYVDSASGQAFRARSFIGIVRSMRMAAWMAPGKQAYMREVAKRVGLLDGGKSRIDTTNAEAFIRSLETFGWLQRIQ